jgi:hypothetical protein
MRQVNPLMQMQKMMGLLEKDKPQVCHGLSYKDVIGSRWMNKRMGTAQPPSYDSIV